MASISYSKLLEPVSDVISCMETMLSGTGGATTGDQRECYKRIHAYSWGLHTLVMDVITAIGIENAATRPAVLERFNSLVHPIKTNLNNLDAGFDGDLTDEQYQIIAYVMATIAFIERMMNNVWRFSLIKHDRLDFSVSAVDSALLTQKVVSVLGQPALQAIGISAMVAGDETWLSYAFGEIATNICSHGDPASVSFDGRRKGNRLQITIFDAGSGFAYADAEDPFLPYWQASEHNQGLGLGLYLARAYIESSGGTVAISSESSIGTTLNVLLPLAH
ncbi:MAG: HAMP domain-containing sensor histidine kinase [Chloroflexi bacterium]|nr:HAMP domain-containing sensor histidine kinase [Chloroflexota bacterium]